MITLHQPPPAWGLPNISPFCLKLETYLKMAGIEYKTAPGDIRKAPNGRIPYIEAEGKLMGDSTLIMRYLKEHFGDPLDSKLTAEQRAHALAIQRLVENHLYFAGAWLRWTDEASWKYVREFFRKLLPPVVGGMIVKAIKKDMIAIVKAQGMGEHPRAEIVAFAKADLDAISTLLGEGSYFLGEEPSSIDATLYGFLVHLLWVPWEGPLKAHARGLPNLPAYCERMKRRYWS